MSLRKNLISNGLANGLQKVVRLVEQLALVPLFLHFWGAAYYGEYLTITAIPAILAFTDFGVGAAGANTFVLRYAAAEYAGAAAVAKANFLILLGLIGVALLAAGVALSLLDVSPYLPHAVIGKSEGAIAFVALFTSRLLGFLFQPLEAFFRAVRKAAIGLYFQVGYAVARMAVAALVIVMGGHIVEVAVSDVTVTIVFGVIYYFCARAQLPGFSVWGATVHRAEAMSLLKTGAGFFLIPAWQAVFFQGTTLVVRATLGPEAVTIFNTLRTLCRSISQLLGMISNSVFPELQVEWATGNKDKARMLFRTAFAGTLVVSVAGVVVLYLLGPTIYHLWTRGALNPSPLLWAYFLASVLLSSMWWTGAMVQRAVNRPFGVAFVGFLGAVASVVASRFLSESQGLEGAALGSLLLDIVMSIYVLPAACRLLLQPLRLLPRETVADLAMMWRKRLG